MRQVAVTLAVVATVATAGCGDDETAQERSGQAPEAAQQAREAAPETGREGRGPQALARETQEVLRGVAGAGGRLVRDPRADVREDLSRAQEQAGRLALQARRRAEEPGRDGGATAGEQERELLGRLASVNDRTARTAERLRDVRDPQDVRRIAAQELSAATGDLASVGDQLGQELPGDVRRGVERLGHAVP